MAKKQPKKRRKIKPPKKLRKIKPPSRDVTNGQAGAKDAVLEANRKIREQQQATILESLSHGSNRLTAHGAAGVNKDKFYAWMKDDEFRAKVVAAETASIRAVDGANFKQAMKPGGHQDRKIFYSRRGAMIEKLQISGPSGGPVQTAPSPLNDDELRGLTDDELERLAYGIKDKADPASE